LFFKETYPFCCGLWWRFRELISASSIVFWKPVWPPVTIPAGLRQKKYEDSAENEDIMEAPQCHLKNNFKDIIS
ncbi:UNVERIFIED_CONTAM: hypothetical protein NY603_28225, partial [Bacteroidetes bacterium 56_B9]